jgi:hypothetical protein
VIVAEAVAELEAERMARLLELDAGLEQLVPGVGELLVACLLEPVGAPVHELADIAERYGLPLAVDHHGFLGVWIPATRLLADLGGDVGDIDELLAEQEGPVEADMCQVGTGAVLGRGGDAGQQAADADDVVVDLDAGRLLVGGGDLVLEVGVVRRDERALVHHREGLRSGPYDGRCDQGAGGTERCTLEEISTRRRGYAYHSSLPMAC